MPEEGRGKFFFYDEGETKLEAKKIYEKKNVVHI